MPFPFRTTSNAVSRETDALRPGIGHLLIAAVVSLAVIITGTLVVNLQSREIEARRRVDLLVAGSSLRARLSRELNSVLYLTSGMTSYLAVRHKSLERSEVEAILGGLYRDARHVRNFAVAVGYRLSYVYPVKGNEIAIGLNYPDAPDQWPDVKRAAESGMPVLIGPVALVQGGVGLIYRVPIYIDGKYWGLLSTVIDSGSLLETAIAESASNGIELAIRGKNGKGMDGEAFWGDATLFSAPDVQLIDVDVPGGKWVIALRYADLPQHFALWLLHGLVWLLGLALGWSALVVLVQRAQLGRLALFDSLTGLPNRLLVQDRIDHAMSNLRRNGNRSCLLLFIDLDGFKLVNDRFGHKAGDIALQHTAQRITGAVRETDTVGRWGGDEFIVFMENVDKSKVDDLTAKVRQVVALPTSYEQQQFAVGASIGAAFAPDDGRSLEELVRAADSRMYQNKAGRRRNEPPALT
jgi:diguanylate cyclase (GGDEF)-like protein